MIIDAHSHLVKDVIFDCEHTEEYMLEKNRKYGIGGGIVQPFVGRPYIEETEEYHNRIFRFCQEVKRKKKIFFIFSRGERGRKTSGRRPEPRLGASFGEAPKNPRTSPHRATGW